jgi:hypothetical protein
MINCWANIVSPNFQTKGKRPAKDAKKPTRRGFFWK